MLLIASAILVILACNFPSATPVITPNDVAARVATTLQAATEAAQTSIALASPTPTLTPTVTPSPTPQVISIAYQNISVLVPANLANSATITNTTGIEFPYTNPSAGTMPQHIKMILNGYPIQGTTLQPQILVFPAEQYSQYGNGNRYISGLRNLHYQHGQPFPQNLPAGSLDAAVQSINFASGSGIRYLTQFDQNPLPINNHELIYYFHGITSNGRYYLEAILPVQAPFLAPNSNPNSPLPPNGIPFQMGQSYFNTIAQQLNAISPVQFNPALTVLDSLIQSISVQ